MPRLTATATPDRDAIKARIDLSRSTYRESVINGLVTGGGSSSGAYLQQPSSSVDSDEAELRRLQDMDERMQTETIELELLKQEISQNLRGAKGIELQRLSKETEVELELFEQHREKMLLDMDRKQSEIDVLQRDLRQAEQRLAPRSDLGEQWPKYNRAVGLTGVGDAAEGVSRLIHSVDQERELVGLTQAHATTAALRSAQRTELLRGRDEMQTQRRIPTSYADIDNAGMFRSKSQSQSYDAEPDSNRLGLREKTGSGSVDNVGQRSAAGSSKPATPKNEAMDKLVAEAEALLRNHHRYDSHALLRRLDKSRQRTPGTAADSVDSLFVPSGSSGDTDTGPVNLRQSVAHPSDASVSAAMPQVSTPAGYVSSRDTLDKWLQDTDTAPRVESESSFHNHRQLASALHLHGQYTDNRPVPTVETVPGASFPFSPEPLRSRSATSSAKPASVPLALHSESQAGDGYTHQQQDHQQQDHQQQDHQQQSLNPAAAYQQPQREQYPQQQSNQYNQPSPAPNMEGYQYQYPPHRNPYSVPNQFGGAAQNQQSAQLIQNNNNPNGFYHTNQQLQQQPFYGANNYQIYPEQQYETTSGRGGRSGRRSENQRAARQRRDYDRYDDYSDDRNRDIEMGRDRRHHLYSHYSPTRNSPTPTAASSRDSAEVAGMKARMKALADELEAENRALQFQVSAAKDGAGGGDGGEATWPALASAVKNDAFQPPGPDSGQGPSSGRDNGAAAGGDALSEITANKRRIDDILSKRVETTDYASSSSNNHRGGRSRMVDNSELGKEMSKNEADLIRMRLEMDTIRQRAALEELREEVEGQRVQRKAEKEHEDWLREKKHRLQALRVKKALSVEQKQFEDDMTALGITDDEYLSSKQQPQQIGAADQWQNPRQPQEENDIGAFELSIDGLTIPSRSDIDGDELRVVLGFVGAQDGAMIGRLMSSEWQSCSKAMQRGKSFKRAHSELMKLNTSSDGDSGGGAMAMGSDASVIQKVGAAANVLAVSGGGGGRPRLSKHTTPMEYELMQLSFRAGDQQQQSHESKNQGEFSSQLRVMIEVQVRRGTQGVPKGAGWCTLDPSRSQWGQEAAVSAGAGGSVLPRGPRFGNWRSRLNAGIADPTFLSTTKIAAADENIEISATNSMWVLFRIACPSNSPLNPVVTLLEQDTNSSAVWSAFVDYENYAALADVPPPPLSLRSDSVKSTQSVSSSVGGNQSMLRGERASTGRPPSSAHPPPTAGSSTGRRTARTATSSGDIKTAASSKFSAGLDVLSAIHEMKQLSASHPNNEDIQTGDRGSSGFFELGTPQGPATAKYTKDDGIDVYVDAARFLPNNVTVSRCVVKLLSADMEPIPLNKSESLACGYSNIDSDAASPTYRKKIECRSVNGVFNCTAILLFRVDTLDASALHGVGAGYAAIKVFCTRDRQAVLLPNDPDAMVNTGCFQLPIFAGRVPTGGGAFQDTTLGKGMPRIPCASLLVRILVAPKSSDGLAVLSCADSPENSWTSLGIMSPAPEYNSGRYDGSLCEPQADELLCYSAKLGEKSSSPSSEGGAGGGSSSVKGFLQRVLSTHTGHSFPPAPEGPGVTAVEMQQWANGLLPDPGAVTAMLDYSFAVPYSFEAGLDVNIVSLFNVPDAGMFSSKTMLFKTIYSISPPAMFYHDPPHTEGVHFTADIDLDSSARAPEFLDGYRRLFPTYIEEESYIVLDIRTVLVEKGKKEEGPSVSVEPPGGKRSFFALLPISKDMVYGEGSHFVHTGVYQVPLIEGAVPTGVITAEKPMRALLSALSSPKTDPGHLRLSGGSALVMLQNPLLRGLLRGQNPELYQARTASASGGQPTGDVGMGSVDSSLVARNLELYLVDKLVAAVNSSAGETQWTTDKLKFDPGKFLGVKILSSQFGKSEDQKKMKKIINKHFTDFTGLIDNTF